MIIIIGSFIIAASIVIAGAMVHDAVIEMHNAYIQIAEWRAKQASRRSEQ